MRPWLLGLLPLLACSEPTSPDLICTGAVEVDIHVTRLGADTVARCVVAPPDTVWMPPDTVIVTDTTDSGDCPHGDGHHRHRDHDHRGHHD